MSMKLHSVTYSHKLDKSDIVKRKGSGGVRGGAENQVRLEVQNHPWSKAAIVAPRVILFTAFSREEVWLTPRNVNVEPGQTIVVSHSISGVLKFQYAWWYFGDGSKPIETPFETKVVPIDYSHDPGSMLQSLKMVGAWFSRTNWDITLLYELSKP
jgi:hypothetical protein